MHKPFSAAKTRRRLCQPLDGQMAVFDGLWKVTFHNDGHERKGAALDSMAQYVFLTKPSNGWDGVFGIVKFGYEGGIWAIDDIVSSLRHMMFGPALPEGDLPHTDIYYFAVGRFRSKKADPFGEIDFQQHWQGCDIGDAMLGIYEFNEGTCRICLSVEGGERPLAFVVNPKNGQAVTEIVRLT